jgi:hypothetical protein
VHGADAVHLQGVCEGTQAAVHAVDGCHHVLCTRIE